MIISNPREDPIIQNSRKNPTNEKPKEDPITGGTQESREDFITRKKL